MRIRSLALALLLALPVLSLAQYKPWYNFYNFAYGAKARAMGNAFTAVSDDLTAAFWNPAGLTNLRAPMFHLGYKTTRQHHDYDLQDDAGRGTRLYNFNFDSHLNQIDFFSVSAPVVLWRRPCAFALSYYRYIPYGFKGSAREEFTSLEDPGSSRQATAAFTGSEGFDVLAFSFSVAPTAHFSLGVTLQQFFGSGSLHRQTDALGKEDHSEVTEKLRGRSLILGALFAPVDWLRLGCAWHAGLKSVLDSYLLTWEVGANGGKTKPDEENSLARVAIPEQYSFGLLLKPADWLDLSADYSLINWDKATIEDYFGSAPMPYPQMAAWSKSQQQVKNLRFGLEARLPFRSPGLALRAGWSRDRQLYADQSEKAVCIDAFSCGIGCRFSGNFQVEATYQRQTGDWMENGYFFSDVPTHFRANVFFLALTYRFGHIFKD